MHIPRRYTLPVIMASTLLAACDGGSVVATADAGQQTFQLCATCHSPEPEHRPTGPNLHGLFGRAAGTSAGFFYSESLKKSGIVWDEQTLDAFLANPSGRVPGTFMLAGVPDPGRRKAVIEYLRTLQ